MVQERENDGTAQSEQSSVRYARIAIAIGICVLLGNYCFVTFVYLSSQLGHHAYAPKFFFKSLIRFPLASTLSFGSGVVPALFIATLGASSLLAKFKSRGTRIMMFAIFSIATYLVLITTLRLVTYRDLQFDIRALVPLFILWGIGTVVALVLPYQSSTGNHSENPQEV